MHSYNIVIFIRDIFFLYMSFGKFSFCILANIQTLPTQLFYDLTDPKKLTGMKILMWLMYTKMVESGLIACEEKIGYKVYKIG